MIDQHTAVGVTSVGKHQIVLLLDDDLVITEGLAAGLARNGRTVITCNDLEGGQLAVEWLKPSHVVTDVRLKGMFAYEGLDFIHFVQRHSPDARVILMTGDGADALQLEATERGAAGFLLKPFEVAELDAMLDRMTPPRTASPEWPDIISIPTLDQILAGDTLSTVFQPIVQLSDGEPLGYEALARNQSDSMLGNPETLFQYAGRQHRITDLEMACVASSLRAAGPLPAESLLFMNIHPSVFGSKRLSDTLLREAARAGVALNRIVLEITEQEPLSRERNVIDAIRELKWLGCRFAFDDVGVAYSHLPFIGVIRPSFLKISQQFGTGFETDATKSKIVRNIVALAADFAAELILEGIESSATVKAAVALAIRYGQGFHFARPAVASSFSPDSVDSAYHGRGQ